MFKRTSGRLRAEKELLDAYQKARDTMDRISAEREALDDAHYRATSILERSSKAIRRISEGKT